MSLLVTDGVPIRTKFPDGERLADRLPAPQIVIPRVPQREDAWCYAACAEMVVNYCFRDVLGFIDQCEAVTLIKGQGGIDCCAPKPPTACTKSGCKKEQIGVIFLHFGVVFKGSDTGEQIGAISLAELTDEVVKAQCLVEVIVDWAGSQSSHAVIIAGVIDDWVFVIDPLPMNVYGGWEPYNFVRSGFGQGKWDRTWLGLKRRK